MWRDQWELAGGGTEPGETAEQAATRELFEGSGQVTDHLRFVGEATFRLARDGQGERCAIFSGTVQNPGNVQPTGETDGLMWAKRDELPDGLNPLDQTIIAWAIAR